MLDLRDAATVEELLTCIAAEAAIARDDIFAFVELCMPHDITKKPITVAPHQRVGIDFMLAHSRSVNMWPIGSSKTFSAAAIILWLLGRDPSLRGAIVSATQGQAKKVLHKVRDYIETAEVDNTALRAVFPDLQMSRRPADPWTQTQLFIDRPAGIPDPSLSAFGVDGAILGSRLNFILVDDILSEENTRTKEQRDKVYQFFETACSRLDAESRIIVTNSAWHPDDLLHRLEKQGWPTMRMDILGDIEIKTPHIIDPATGDRIADPWGIEDEIAAHIRPATANPFDTHVRLTAHDPDPENKIGLWPEMFSPARIRELQTTALPSKFNKMYRNICRDDDTAHCRQEWIDKCKEKARGLGFFDICREAQWAGGTPVWTGVDLSTGEGKDDTALFTFTLLQSGLRLILDIDIAKYTSVQIIEKVYEKARRFGAQIIVESNGSQKMLRQFLQGKPGAPAIIDFTTTAGGKSNPHFGVESIFVEMSNGLWLIPNDQGVCSPQVQKFVDACAYYVPDKHTPDILMGAMMARARAWKSGALTSLNGAESDAGASMRGAPGASIMAR